MSTIMAASGCDDGVDLPVIDLSEIPSMHFESSGDGPQVAESVLNRIREACEDWGFFRVINHGVAEDVMERLDRAARELFALPDKVKQRAIFSSYYDGYTPHFAGSPYRETMSFSRLLISDSTRRISDALWPQGNPQFCEAVQEYARKLGEIARTLIKLIVMSLGLEVPKYYNSVFSKCEDNLRMNYYSSTSDGQASSLPLEAHTDYSCLTILYQDHVGGLQVRTKEGNWFPVKPLDHSFAVNIGDTLNIWSNCRYRSAEHRVLDGGWKARLSTAFFLHFADDMEVSAPAEVVDEAHPLRYKPFIFKEYKEYKRQIALKLGPTNNFLSDKLASYN